MRADGVEAPNSTLDSTLCVLARWGLQLPYLAIQNWGPAKAGSLPPRGLRYYPFAIGGRGGRKANLVDREKRNGGCDAEGGLVYNHQRCTEVLFPFPAPHSRVHFSWLFARQISGLCPLFFFTLFFSSYCSKGRRQRVLLVARLRRQNICRRLKEATISRPFHPLKDPREERAQTAIKTHRGRFVSLSIETRSSVWESTHTRKRR